MQLVLEQLMVFLPAVARLSLLYIDVLRWRLAVLRKS